MEMAEALATQLNAEDAVSASDGEINPENAELLGQFNALGSDLYRDQWEEVCRRNVNRIFGNKAQHAGELTAQQLQQLIIGMTKLKSERVPMARRPSHDPRRHPSS